MTVFVALLRAVNVGGTGKLPMAELKAACIEAGLRRVTTYIASGNLVFESDETAERVKALIDGVLRDRFGLGRNQTLLRLPADLQRAIDGNPFAEAAEERPSQLMVSFLDSVAPEGARAALARHGGPERLHLAGDHLYIDYVDGAGRSRLTPAFLDKALGVPATARNWNTTRKLLQLARALT